jgi:hypothetical protein
VSVPCLPCSVGRILIRDDRTSKTDLRDTKAVVPLERFLGAKESVYDPGWLPTRIAAYVLGKPLWWALEQLGLFGEEGDGQSERARTEWWGEYVVLALVERMADAVVAAQIRRETGPAGALYTFEGFRRTFGGVLGRGEMRDIDAKVLIKFMERDRRVVCFDSEVRVPRCPSWFSVLADEKCRGLWSSLLRLTQLQSLERLPLSIVGSWSSRPLWRICKRRSMAFIPRSTSRVAFIGFQRPHADHLRLVQDYTKSVICSPVETKTHSIELSAVA